MAKLKNSNCDKNSKKQIVTKLERLNCDQTQKLKLCKNKKKIKFDNSKTQIVIVIKMTVVTEVVIMTSFSKKHLNTLTTNHSQGSFLQFLRCFLVRVNKTSIAQSCQSSTSFGPKFTKGAHSITMNTGNSYVISLLNNNK